MEGAHRATLKCPLLARDAIGSTKAGEGQSAAEIGAPLNDNGAFIWLTADEKTVWPGGIKLAELSYVYRVRFTGRKAQDIKRAPLEGYGHMGKSEGLVLMDRVLEIEDLSEAAHKQHR